MLYSIVLLSAIQHESVLLYTHTHTHTHTHARTGFPGGAVVKNLPANAGDTKDAGSIPRWESSPEEGNGNLLQCSCLENSMDRGAWGPTVHGVAKSQTRPGD